MVSSFLKTHEFHVVGCLGLLVSCLDAAGCLFDDLLVVLIDSLEQSRVVKMVALVSAQAVLV